MAQRSRTDLLRLVLVAAIAALLVAAVWFRRGIIADALGEIRMMPAGLVAALVGLGVIERVSRADIVRRLLGTGSFLRSLTIHDVGSAASKGLPLGGPLATGLRPHS